MVSDSSGEVSKGHFLYIRFFDWQQIVLSVFLNIRAQSATLGHDKYMYMKRRVVVQLPQTSIRDPGPTHQTILQTSGTLALSHGKSTKSQGPRPRLLDKTEISEPEDR